MQPKCGQLMRLNGIPFGLAYHWDACEGVKGLSVQLCEEAMSEIKVQGIAVRVSHVFIRHDQYSLFTYEEIPDTKDEIG